MAEIDLKRCPFCGGEADVDVGNFGGMVCSCKQCFSQGKQCETEEEAIEAWNRRADDGSETDLSIIGGSNNGSNNRTGIA